MFDNGGNLTLWTIQSREFYDQIEKTGVMYADIESSSLYSDFPYEYNWIADQMRRRIGKPNNEDIVLPLWAWYKWEGKRKRRDLRSSCLGIRGSKMVQIEFKISPSNILLSDFDAWHVVLNNGYIGDTDEDSDNFYSKYQGINTYDLRTSTDTKAIEMLEEMKKSWEKVFDLDKCIKIGFATEDSQTIQATFWELRAEWIKKVDYFIAR